MNTFSSLLRVSNPPHLIISTTLSPFLFSQTQSSLCLLPPPLLSFLHCFLSTLHYFPDHYLSLIRWLKTQPHFHRYSGRNWYFLPVLFFITCSSPFPITHHPTQKHASQITITGHRQQSSWQTALKEQSAPAAKPLHTLQSALKLSTTGYSKGRDQHRFR